MEKMTITDAFKNRRDAMLELPEVTDRATALKYAKRLMASLKFDTVDEQSYELLSGDFQLHCRSLKINTNI